MAAAAEPMTEAQAIALARAATGREGWAWPEPVRALRCQLGLVPLGWFWEVFSSPDPDRWMTFARIDEATGEVRGLGRSRVA